jgi:hypothetical protein
MELFKGFLADALAIAAYVFLPLLAIVFAVMMPMPRHRHR